MFRTALSLPGDAFVRLAGSVREYAVPSTGEENTCLYNLACCFSALGDAESAMEALEDALKNGFDDLSTCRTDPDLKPVRDKVGTARFEGMLLKYTGPLAALNRRMNNYKTKGGDSSTKEGSNRPWLTF